MSRTTNARRRIALLASSSFVASSVLAGVGGAALTAFGPSVALAATICTPTEGTYASPTTTNANNIVCGPGSSTSGGVGFTETGSGGNITVAGNSDITGGGVWFATGNAGANLAVGVDNTFTGGVINASGTTNDGVHVESTSDGNVEIKIGEGTLTGVTGGANGLVATTGGAGTSTITLGVSVTGQNGVGAHQVGAGVAFTQTKGDLTGSTSGLTVTEGGDGATLTTSAGTTITGQNGDGINVSGGNGATVIGTLAGAVTGSNGHGVIIDATPGGTGTINMTYSADVVGSNGGISQATSNGDNTATLTPGIKVDGGSGDGVNLTATGSGNVTVTDGLGVNGVNAGHIESTGGNGITAISDSSGTGSVTVNYHGTIGQDANIAFRGVDAEIQNGSNNNDITVNVGNINAGAFPFAPGTATAGIFAQTQGGGNINITTDKGTNVSSGFGDGIDGYALGGGNVTLTLLDGSISSNTSGSGGLDPHAVNLTAVTNGTVTVDDQSDVTNSGPGSAVQNSTENGLNSYYLDNTQGNGPTVTENAGVFPSTDDTINVTASGNSLVTGTAADGTQHKGVYVKTDVGSDIENNSIGNGITASYTGTGGAGTTTVDVVAQGDIGKLGPVGNDGVNASASSGNINVEVGNVSAFNHGVNAYTSGTGNVTVTTDAGTTINTLVGDGIRARNYGATGSVTVTANGDIGTALTPVGHDGISAGVEGDPTATGIVSVTAQGNIFANNYGIHARNEGEGASPGSNSIDVEYGTTNSSNIAMTTGGTGILAEIANGGKNDGDLTVNFGTSTNGGTTTITVAGGPADAGVNATTDGDGSVFVTEGAAGNIGTVGGTATSGDGIDATSTGASMHGSLSVTVDGAINSAVVGVFENQNTTSDGNFGVTTGAGSDIQSVSTGISAINNGVGGAVTVDAEGSVAAGDAIGDPVAVAIDAEIGNSKNNDNVSVTTGSGTISAYGTAIYAVNGDGSTPGSGGLGAVEVTTGTGTVTGALGGTGDGIFARNDGLGTLGVSVTTNGDVFGDPGVTAIGTGLNPVNVHTFKDVTGLKQAILAQTEGGDNTVHVSTSGSVITGGTGAAIEADATSASTKSGTVFGNVSVTTDAGTDLESTSGQGILATAQGGNVTVNQDGTIGATTAVGAQGINASTTGSGFVHVFASDNITASTGGVLTTAVDGENQVTLATNKTIDGGSGAGVSASSTGAGSVTVTDNQGQNETHSGHIESAGGDGIDATTTGTGEVTVHYHGTIGANAPVGGKGVDAEVNNTGNTTDLNVEIGVVNSTGTGVFAHSTGSGNVTVTTDTGAAITSNAGTGIDAAASFGGAVTVNANGNVLAADGGITTASVDGDNNVNLTPGIVIGGGGGDGVSATSSGAGNVTVTDGLLINGSDSGTIDSNASGIQAIADGTSTGSITVHYHGTIGSGGPVFSDGVNAQIQNASNGSNIEVEVGNVNAFVGSGIYTSTAGSGSISIVTDKNTNVSSVFGDGIDGYALGGGNVSLTLLDGSITSNTSGSGGVDPHAINMTAVGNGTVMVDAQSDVTNSGPGEAVLNSTENGLNSFYLDNTKASNPTVTEHTFGGGDDAIHLTSDGTSLVSSTAADGLTTAQGLWVKIDAGTNITVDGSGSGDGIRLEYDPSVTGAGSPGSDVETVILNGSIGGSAVYNGIDAFIGNAGAGNINISVGDGVDSNSITAGNIGINAVTDGTGNITISTSALTTISSTDGDAIRARQNGSTGSVNVTALGDLSSVNVDGISAGVEGNSSSTGSVSVTAEGNISAGKYGIHGLDEGLGSVTINYGDAAAADLTLNSASTGILAELSNASNDSTVSVNVGDGTHTIGITAGANGIEATTAGTGSAQVTTNLTTISAGTTGIYASSGGGDVSVSVNGGSVTGATGDGIDAFSFGGLGTVTVGTSGGVLGAINGIDAEGSGTVSVTTDASVAGTSGTGIIAISDGSGFVNVSANGNVAGGVTGILASSDGGEVDVSTNAFDTVTGGTGSGIDASTTGPGDVNVDVGYVNTVSGAIDGVSAANTGTGAGDVNVFTNTDDSITGSSGSGIDASTSGTGSVNVSTGWGNSIFGGTNGITAANTGTAEGDVNVSTYYYNSVTGESGSGIDASTSGTGSVNVSVGYSNEINGGTNGIVAASTGSGSGSVNVSTSSFTDVTGGTGSGIDASTTGSGSVNVDVGYDNFVTGGTNGIVADNTGSGSGSVNVSVADYGTVEGNGSGGSAIEASNSGTGSVNVTVGDNAELYGGAYGINATNSGTAGSVNVNVGTTNDPDFVGSISIGAIGNEVDGIYAAITNSSNFDSVNVTNYSTISTGGGAFAGIEADTAGKGSVTVNNYGDIDPAAYGIFASGGGDVTINNSTASVIGGVGIHGDTFGSSSTVSITLTDPVILGVTVPATVTGTTGNGIEAFANSGGNVSIDTSGGDNVTGATNGIVAEAFNGFGSGTISINTLTSGNVTPIVVKGLAGDGINAQGSGTVSITAGNVSGSGAAGGLSNGIYASSVFGDVDVVTQGNVSGDAAGNAGLTGGSGISALSTEGTGSVSVSVYAPYDPVAKALSPTTVTGGNVGILASSTGSGVTSVVVHSLGVGGGVTATGAGTVNGGKGPVGIWATSGNDDAAAGKATSLTVDTFANVTATNGRAIVTNSGNNAAITLEAGVVAKGLGDATHAVVDMTTATGATTTLTNNGLITSKNATPASFADLAVMGTTGGVKEVNNGVIWGRQNFGGQTAGNNLDIENVGAWHNVGTSTLGTAANTELVNNTGYVGLANAGVATTWAFGAGTNTINNAGTIIAGEGMVASAHTSGPNATPAVTTITGTATLNNTGWLILGSSSTSAAGAASDRSIDSVVLATKTTIGGTGHIALDANLWSDSQSAAGCTGAALTAADCLVVGGSTGNNAIVVKDTNAHSVGSFNPGGIVIVSGSSAASTFHLDPTSDYFNAGGGNQFGGATNILNKPGMFFYDLAFDGHNELLISVPKAAAFEFSSLGGAVNDVWYATTQTWFDRQADLRDSLQGRANGSEPGIWLKGFGDWATRNHTDVVGLFNRAYAFDVSYDQTTGGLIGGIDLLNVTNKNEAWVAGIQGGAVDSNVDFKASPDRYHLSGETIGGYVTYLSGGLYVDGIVNANILKMHANLPGLMGNPTSAPLTPEADVHSVGGQVEAGYEMPLGANAFWEPLGVLSYVSEKFGDLAVPGGLAHIDHAESFRGSLGARVGLTQSYQFYKVKLAVTGRVWDEFTSNTNATLSIPGGPGFVSGNDIKGAFGEFSGQANIFSTTSGLSAFVTGGYKFKSNYNEGTVTIGARYQW
jgi:hypothetical protein